MDRAPMRVALTLEQCWHQVPGGTATSAVALARALADRADLHVVGVAAAHRHPPAADVVPPVPVAHLPLGRLALYESWHRLRRPLVESVAGDVDVVHATGVAVPGTRRPLVVTVHDLDWRHDPHRYTRQGRRFFARAFELTRRHAALVLCPSRQTQADVVAAGIAEDRTRVVPWGVEATDQSAAVIAAVLRRWRVRRPYVLWVGTAEPRKNLATLTEAWRRLAGDALLVLAGPPGWGVDVWELARPLRDRVRVLGPVPGADLQALYAAADVFCYPSLREGFGLPVLEAMAHGVPIVTSTGSAMADLAGADGVAVDPLDPDALAGALAGLLDDPARRVAQGGALADRAAAYTWAATADATVAAYREACG